jgi:hypothetical protein
MPHASAEDSPQQGPASLLAAIEKAKDLIAMLEELAANSGPSTSAESRHLWPNSLTVTRLRESASDRVMAGLCADLATAKQLNKDAEKEPMGFYRSDLLRRSRELSDDIDRRLKGIGPLASTAAMQTQLIEDRYSPNAIRDRYKLRFGVTESGNVIREYFANRRR